MYNDFTIFGETLGADPDTDSVVDAFVRHASSDPPIEEIEAVLEFARLVKGRGLQLYIGMDGDGDLLVFGKDESGAPLERKKFWPYQWSDKKSTSETGGFLAAKSVITDFIVPSINEELIRHLRTHPQDIYELAPRRFEVLVADLLKDMGYEVELTPESRDGGRDILAVLKIPAGEVLTVVECKRYGRDKRVGVDLIQRLLWVAGENDRASRAMLVTSAYFTKGVWDIQRDYRWKLGLADFDELYDWLSKFGSWESSENSGLWVSK